MVERQYHVLLRSPNKSQVLLEVGGCSSYRLRGSKQETHTFAPTKFPMKTHTVATDIYVDQVSGRTT